MRSHTVNPLTSGRLIHSVRFRSQSLLQVLHASPNTQAGRAPRTSQCTPAVPLTGISCVWRRRRIRRTPSSRATAAGTILAMPGWTRRSTQSSAVPVWGGAGGSKLSGSKRLRVAPRGSRKRAWAELAHLRGRWRDELHLHRHLRHLHAIRGRGGEGVAFAKVS